MGRTKRGSLRLHLGAHKTATTHLQQSAEAIAPTLTARGVGWIPLQKARPIIGYLPSLRDWRLLHQARHAPALERYLYRLKARSVLKRLGNEAGAAPCIATSDENALGYIATLFGSDRLYTNLKHLRLFREMHDVVDVRVFITIRSLDEFIPSMYAEGLKLSNKIGREDFHRVTKTLVAAEHPWLEMIERASATLGPVPLEIWIYDDYRAHKSAFIDRLTGTDCGPIPELVSPVRTRTPSEAAIALAEAVDIEDISTRAAHVREIYAADIEADNGPKFSPLSDAVKTRLRDGFARDIAAIERRFPGMIHRFGPVDGNRV
jgi:hypothetical protein